MQVITEEGSRPIKIWTDDIEQEALEQLKNIAKLPFIHKNGVVAMPDVHWGIGATVGSVLATHRAIIPAAVGVDIGCGMCATRLNVKASQLPDSLQKLRHSIERNIPLGPGGRHTKTPQLAENAHYVMNPPRCLDEVTTKAFDKAVEQLGTLGSGNHFIELCLDDKQDVWVMLHSGSRGIGNMIGRYYIEKAKKLMESYFITLPDMNLAYLPDGTQEQQDYISAVKWAQDFAAENRRSMMRKVISDIGWELPKLDVQSTGLAINCHHNYVERENHGNDNVWVTRKGAIRARSGDLGIIPGSMGTKSYIVRGLGSADSYHSCSHGAGRKMGRRAASERFTVEDLIEQTKGVECRKDVNVVDEIPSAYKDIDTVMANQTDLVEVLFTLKQVMCVKGA